MAFSRTAAQQSLTTSLLQMSPCTRVRTPVMCVFRSEWSEKGILLTWHASKSGHDAAVLLGRRARRRMHLVIVSVRMQTASRWAATSRAYPA